MNSKPLTFTHVCNAHRHELDVLVFTYMHIYVSPWIGFDI